VEAGQEPTAGAEDGVHGAHVLGAAAGIDGAKARVLPDAVEGPCMVTAEREDVALLEPGGRAFGGGQATGLDHGGLCEVATDGVVAAGDQEADVVTTPAARHGDTPARRRGGAQKMNQWRRRLGQLPSVAGVHVQVLPELGYAHTGHDSPS